MIFRTIFNPSKILSKGPIAEIQRDVDTLKEPAEKIVEKLKAWGCE